ncbi:MAG: chemotaxis protein CheW [Deltaproteobacteria bacterium]|nr:chemotaxis protein CheW [Deltaproteobacteria bacterium]
MKDAAGKTSGDCLIFELDSKLYGLGAQAVESIAEVDKTSFLPGGRGFVHGVIGIRGTPVAVIDAGAALAGPPRPEAAGGGKGEVIELKRIVVLKDGDRVMGLDIGEADVFFLRGAELEIEERPLEDKAGGYIKEKAIIGKDGGRTVEFIDWGLLFEETGKLLSAEERSGQKGSHSR